MVSITFLLINKKLIVKNITNKYVPIEASKNTKLVFLLKQSCFSTSS